MRSREVLNSENEIAKRLIDVTIESLDASGESGIRLVDLAEAAGCSKSSVYYFFGSRAGLVAAAQRERALRIATVGYEYIEEFIEGCESPEEWVEFAVSMVSLFGGEDGMRRRRQRVEILGSSVSSPSLYEDVLSIHDAAVPRFAAILERAQEKGLMSRTHSAFAVSIWLQSALTGRYLVENSGDVEQIAAWDSVHLELVRALLS